MTQLAKPEQKPIETEEGVDVPIESEVFSVSKFLTPKQIEAINQNLDVLSTMIRAFEGKEVNPENDVITRLINVKNILERSNFPTMPIINFQIYCRLVAKYHPELTAFKDWADFQAEALKSYKALSSEQYVDMMKAQLGYMPPPQTSTNISLGGQPQQQQQQKKGRFFNRGGKPEKSEFENE